MGRLVHLHNHTDYSFLDGMMTPAMMVAAAEQSGCYAVAITDHGEVAGHIDFMDAVGGSSVKPIYGYEGYHWVPCQQENKKKPFHLTLWARNQEGFRNLWGLASDVYSKADELGHKRPLMTVDVMRKYGNGIIAGSACMSGAIAKMLASGDRERASLYLDLYRDIFDDFYIEIHTNSMPEQASLNRLLIDFAHDKDVPVVYAIDSHYAVQSDAAIHDAYMGIQFRKKASEQTEVYSPDYYLMDEAEIRRRLAYLGDEAVARTFAGVERLVDSISFDVSVDRSLKMPHTAHTGSSSEALVEMAREGMARKVASSISDEWRSTLGEYVDRMNYELDVICNNGLADYFLVVSDYTKWAKERMLVGPARGSAGGSLVCYLLDITEVDPMQAGLYFERFLNEGRLGSLPDIDLDFPDDRRHMIEDYLKSVYGADRVATIGTVGRFKAKSAIKDAAAYYGMDFKESSELTSLIDTSGTPDGDFDTVLEDIPNQEKLAWYQKQWGDVFKVAQRIYGLARQSGKHPAGVIISPEPLSECLPTRVRDGRVSTQFDMHAVDKMGFLKVDILGLRTLATLTQLNDLLGEPVDFYSLRDTSDGMSGVFDMLSAGDTVGVFQLESDGMTGLCRAMKPRSIDDLSVAVALYRPGIIDAGMFDVYLNRRSGHEPVVFDHPLLEPILGDTYGVMVYQEQVMEICQSLAGYTMVEADNMRSIIGKKKIDKMAEEGVKFVDGCVANGIDRSTATGLFENIKAFGRYSFNRAHSYAYGMISMWTAWAKANHPAEYMTALLNTDPANAETYLAWCKRNGVAVLPPDVNRSGLRFTVDGGAIRFGLLGVKHIGESAATGIIENRPYTGLADFVSKVPSRVNKRSVEVLIDCGAFDSLDQNRAHLAHWFSLVKKRGTQRYLPDAVEAVPDYTTRRKSELEAELLGFSVGNSMFDVALQRLGDLASALVPADNIEVGSVGVAVLQVGSVRKHTTKGGSEMAFVDATDSFYGKLSMTVMPQVYAGIRTVLKAGMVAVAEIKAEEYRGKTSYQITNIVPVMDGSPNER